MCIEPDRGNGLEIFHGLFGLYPHRFAFPPQGGVQLLELRTEVHRQPRALFAAGFTAGPSQPDESPGRIWPEGAIGIVVMMKFY